MEYLTLLRILRPNIESKFPGISVYLGCRTEFTNLLGNEKLVPSSEFHLKKNNFGHVFNIETDFTYHPIEKFLTSSDIPLKVNVPTQTDKANVCVICTKGNHPTGNLESPQINRLKNLAQSQGFHVQLDINIDNAAWVVGVESVPLFEAAANGINTSLVPTGLGEYLYRNMFSSGKVLKI